MTTAIDSETPNSQPYSTMIATTLNTTMATLTMARKAIRRLHVTPVRIMKEKMRAITTPWMAEVRNAFSETIHVKKMPPLNLQL